MNSSKTADAEKFARAIINAKLVNNQLHFGHFILQGNKSSSKDFIYDKRAKDLINNKQNYAFQINEGRLELSLQLWLNINNHFKFRAITKINNQIGYVFSVNLTTEKESPEVIYLINKIKFSEKHQGDKKSNKANRQQKQILFAGILRKLNIQVSDNNEITLGIFNPKKGVFIDTTPSKFLQDFLIISILKGHFMGNKGYNLEIIPNYSTNSSEIIDDKSDNIRLPKKVNERKSKRTIPLTYRYIVFKRDKYKCVACGRSPKDGVKLHIDHKTPFSLGGTTVLNNLQTLCEECNISKSNKHIDH